MQLDLLPEILVLGLSVAALYGLLPVAIILTYRISRTIGFVHGGIAILGASLYAVLVLGFEANLDPQGYVSPAAGMLIVVAVGALVGVAYGALVMSRWMAELPGLTLTVISIAGLLLIGNLSAYYLTPAQMPIIPSPFGDGSTEIGGAYLTDHRLAIVVVLVVLVTVLAFFLSRTYTGLAIRAISDDVEASVWCGANLRQIGTGVYGFSGAVAALAGAMYAAAVAEAVDGLILVMVRGMLIAVAGGLRSLPLALGAAALYGVLETALKVDFFGGVSAGTEEIVLSGMLLAVIIVAARYRRENFFQLERRQA